METPQLLRGRSLEGRDGDRAADMNDTDSQTSGTQNPSSGSPARSTTSCSNGAGSLDDEGKVGDIIEQVGGGGGGAGGGESGAIVKLGWTDSSGSSNDDICSYLGGDDETDKEGNRSRIDGGTHGADSRDDDRKVDEIIEHVAGGESGVIVKLGWTNSSGSSSDEICSHLVDDDETDKESGSRNDGGTHGADSRDDEGKVNEIFEHVVGGAGGGENGAIVKLGWTNSSGSSNDEVCSYLSDNDDGGKESGSRNDGGTHGADSRDDERKLVRALLPITECVAAHHLQQVVPVQVGLGLAARLVGVARAVGVVARVGLAATALLFTDDAVDPTVVAVTAVLDTAAVTASTLLVAVIVATEVAAYLVAAVVRRSDEICTYLGDDGNGDKKIRSRNSGGIKNSSDGDYGGINGVVGGKEGRGGKANSGNNTINSSNTDKSISESEPNLHRGNLLRMVGSDALGDGQQRPHQLQAQQSTDSEREDRAELRHHCGDESSSSVEPIKPKATSNVEPFTSDSQDPDSTPNPIELEKDHPDKAEPLTANSEDSYIPTGPKKNAHSDMETLPADNNQDRRSNYVEPGSEKAPQEVEPVRIYVPSGTCVFLHERSTRVSPREIHIIIMISETPSADSPKKGEVSSDPIDPENAQQGAETPAVDMPSLAANDAESDKGQGVHEDAVVAGRPEAGSDRESQMMARLLEYESGPRLVDVEPAEEIDEVAVGEEHEGEVHEGAIREVDEVAIGEVYGGVIREGNAGEGRKSGGGRSWWVWLWQCFLVTVIVSVYATTVWNAWVSSTSVSTTTTTTTTTPTGVRAHTVSEPFLRAMKNALVERTGLISFNLSPTTRSGPGGDDDSPTKRGNNNRRHATNNKTDVNKNERARDKNAKKNSNDNKNANTAENSQQSRSQRKERSRERWAARWAAWAAEFEEMVDGPWV